MFTPSELYLKISPMNIKNYLWLLPFCSFIIGYSITQWIFRVDSVITPHLIGKYVHEILPLLSQHKLNIRLINQKEEANIPEGIIISQTPQPGRSIKPNQSLYIVTTKKPPAIQAPDCLDKNLTTLLPQLQKMNIYPRVYKIMHSHPENICFAQFPQPQELLEKNRLILYISAENNKPIIWPRFIGTSLEEALYFLDEYDIKPYIINDSPYLDGSISKCSIIDQRPLAGTLITLNETNKLSVQFRIR
jgi:beta-lactam-binding protein with PASTA domain